MSYSNRVYDTSVNRLVVWTSPVPDVLGNLYPGPGTFGVDTQGFTTSKLLGPDSTPYIVAGVASGATAQDCSYFDSGNGAGLAAALNDASVDGGVVEIRGPLNIDLSLPGAPTELYVDNNVSVVANTTAFQGLNITFRSTGDVLQLHVSGSLSGCSISAPAPTALMTAVTAECYVLVRAEATIQHMIAAGDGEAYGAPEAANQPARAMFLVDDRVAEFDAQIYDTPPTGILLADPAQSFDAVRIQRVIL